MLVGTMLVGRLGVAVRCSLLMGAISFPELVRMITGKVGVPAYSYQAWRRRMHSALRELTLVLQEGCSSANAATRYMCVYNIYIYIYIERERERERAIYTHIITPRAPASALRGVTGSRRCGGECSGPGREMSTRFELLM